MVITALHAEELVPVSDEEAPRVVLVHGSMDRLRSFARLGARLPGCHVIVYDRRGYGRSRRAEPLASSVLDHADDLVELLEGRHALAFGHSYGGVVVLAAAQRRSDLITSAIVYEAPMPWFEWWHDAPSPIFRAGADGVDPGDAALGFVEKMVGSERFARMPERFRAELRKDGPAFLAEMRALGSDPPPFDPARILPRVLVVRGGDSAQRHVRGADELVTALPDSELVVVEGAGHGGHISHPDVLADLVHAELAIARSAERRPPARALMRASGRISARDGHQGGQGQ